MLATEKEVRKNSETLTHWDSILLVIGWLGRALHFGVNNKLWSNRWSNSQSSLADPCYAWRMLLPIQECYLIATSLVDTPKEFNNNEQGEFNSIFASYLMTYWKSFPTHIKYVKYVKYGWNWVLLFIYFGSILWIAMLSTRQHGQMY